MILSKFNIFKLIFFKRQRLLITLACLSSIFPILPQFFPLTSWLLLPGVVFLITSLYLLWLSGDLKIQDLFYDRYLALFSFYLCSFIFSVIIFHDTADLSVVKNLMRGAYLLYAGPF